MALPNSQAKKDVFRKPQCIDILPKHSSVFLPLNDIILKTVVVICLEGRSLLKNKAPPHLLQQAFLEICPFFTVFHYLKTYQTEKLPRVATH